MGTSPKSRSDELDQLLTANEGKPPREYLTLIRIFEELRGRGYEGGYDAVRRYARKWAKDRSQQLESQTDAQRNPLDSEKR